MKKLLLVSPFFPDKGALSKHNKLLIEALSVEYEIVVATVNKPSGIPQEINCITSSYIPTEKYESIKRRLFPNRILVTPDIFKYTINEFLLPVCKKYLESTKVDLIVTISWPCSSCLIGEELKRIYHIPWIAYFYDAWTDNPYRRVTSFLRKKDKMLEYNVAKSANAIIHTNKIIESLWLDRYGLLVRDKIFVLPFCLNKEMLSRPVPPKIQDSKKIIISYIGTTMGSRNFQPIIKALKKALDNGYNVIDKIEFRIIGNLLPSDNSLIEFYGLGELFKHYGFIENYLLESYYIDSDVLCVIDGKSKNNIFFPSKLLDYFYYQKYILGISPKIGVTTNLLQDSNNQCFENDDIEGIAGFIMNIIDSPEILMSNNRSYYMNFTPERTLGVFNDIVKKINV